MLKKEITLKETANEKRKVVCRGCNKKTNHQVYASVQDSWDETEFDIQGINLYEVICCMGCDELSFRLAESDSENIGYDDEGKIFYPEREEIYPGRLMGRPMLKDYYYLPEKIKVVYKETHTAFSAGLKILAGVGIGALIEATCSQEEATGDNLKEKIDSLVQKDVLTAKNAEILHKTRFLRNRSAHEIEASSDAELSAAFDIIESLLQNLYLIPRIAEGLKS